MPVRVWSPCRETLCPCGFGGHVSKCYFAFAKRYAHAGLKPTLTKRYAHAGLERHETLCPCGSGAHGVKRSRNAMPMRVWRPLSRKAIHCHETLCPCGYGVHGIHWLARCYAHAGSEPIEPRNAMPMRVKLDYPCAPPLPSKTAFCDRRNVRACPKDWLAQPVLRTLRYARACVRTPKDLDSPDSQGPELLCANQSRSCCKDWLAQPVLRTLRYVLVCCKSWLGQPVLRTGRCWIWTK